MSTATIPMAERRPFTELDLFTQLTARVVEIENSARDDLRGTNQEIRELRESIDSLNSRMDTFSAMLNSHDHRIGVAETMAKDATASAAYVEDMVDGMTGPAKTVLLPKKEELGAYVVVPDVVPRSLGPNDLVTIAEFMELEGLPGHRSMTPQGMARVLNAAGDIFGIARRAKQGNIALIPVFMLRSFARFLQSGEFRIGSASLGFTRWVMAEDKEGKLRGEG